MRSKGEVDHVAAVGGNGAVDSLSIRCTRAFEVAAYGGAKRA
jgi:hypothetical protein